MFPLTAHFPKPLLPLGHETIIGRLMGDIDTIGDIKRHVIVTNHRYIGHFTEWCEQQHFVHPVSLVDDGSTQKENRLGAVGDLLLAIGCCRIDDDILVMAADNILSGSLQGFVDFYIEKKSSVIMCYRENDLSRLQRTGVILKDDAERVVRMEEKPRVPLSHWAVPPFYIYAKKDLWLISRYVEEYHDTDAPGALACYMSTHTDIHAWRMTMERVDVGNRETYLSLRQKADEETRR